MSILPAVDGLATHSLASNRDQIGCRCLIENQCFEPWDGLRNSSVLVDRNASWPSPKSRSFDLRCWMRQFSPGSHTPKSRRLGQLKKSTTSACFDDCPFPAFGMKVMRGLLPPSSRMHRESIPFDIPFDSGSGNDERLKTWTGCAGDCRIVNRPGLQL